MSESADIKFHRYDRRVDLADGLASGVAALLAGAIAARGSATLAVSGGSTPKLFFEHLATRGIDWPNVTITLVDERCVAETSERSNARLVREHLLRDKAAEAHFVPLYNGVGEPEDIPTELQDRFHRPTHAFDVVVLGMGTDGHTASFFPGSDSLAEAIDPKTRHPVVSVTTSSQPEPRITLTLPLLLSSRFLAIHIEGEDKLEAFEAAKADGPIEAMPIRAVLRAERREPINVFWTA